MARLKMYCIQITDRRARVDCLLYGAHASSVAQAMRFAREGFNYDHGFKPVVFVKMELPYCVDEFPDGTRVVIPGEPPRTYTHRSKKVASISSRQPQTAGQMDLDFRTGGRGK